MGVNPLNQNYRITIHDIHTMADEVSDTTSTVFGSMDFSDGHYVIHYIEPSGDLEGVKTRLLITGPDSVLISRDGSVQMDLMLEREVRHNCAYSVPEGTLMMGVYARTIDSEMNDLGGTLDLDYDIDFNAGFVSGNKLHITVDPIRSAQ